MGDVQTKSNHEVVLRGKEKDEIILRLERDHEVALRETILRLEKDHEVALRKKDETIFSLKSSLKAIQGQSEMILKNHDQCLRMFMANILGETQLTAESEDGRSRKKKTKTTRMTNPEFRHVTVSNT